MFWLEAGKYLWLRVDDGYFEFPLRWMRLSWYWLPSTLSLGGLLGGIDKATIVFSISIPFADLAKNIPEHATFPTVDGETRNNDRIVVIEMGSQGTRKSTGNVTFQKRNVF